MGMKEIGTGIKQRLRSIQGLRVFATDELPDSINQFPAALVVPGETAYVTTLANDADYNFRIILVFSRADSPSAVSRMLPYIALSGSQSVLEAIHKDVTLDGSADTCKLTRNMGIGALTWGGSTYMSTEFQLQVWAD